MDSVKRWTKRLAIGLALLAPLLACVALLYPFTGLRVRWALRQTMASLPPAPVGSVLIRGDTYYAGGTSVVAYAHRALYGTDQRLEEVLAYYEQELSTQGWKLQDEPATMPEQLFFRRADDEALRVAGGEHAVAAWLYPATPEGVESHRTVYRIEVARTEGPMGIELTPHPQ